MIQIRDVMSRDFKFIAPDTSLQSAARIMRDLDIGFLPVADNDRMIGMITDRDITVRAVAEGQADVVLQEQASGSLAPALS